MSSDRSAGTSALRAAARELALATAVFLPLILFYFSPALLNGKASAMQAREGIPEALVNMSEMVYELEPALLYQARELRAGAFPLWNPLSHGGNPQLGKMQNGLFAPYHLPLYLLPAAWTAWAFMLVVALKAYLAHAFAFLYARRLGLGRLAAACAGALFAFSPIMYGELFAWSGTAFAFPLLLLLVELYWDGERERALLLWPWAAALPFFAGHFETAAYANLVAAAAFAYRSWRARARLARPLADWIAASALGAALAAGQIVPAWQYVREGMSRVLHTPEWGDWWYFLAKHYGPADLPALILGLLGLAAALVLLRRARSASSAAAALAPAAGAAAFLAVGLGLLATLGFDATLAPLSHLGADAPHAVVGLFFLALAACGGADAEPAGVVFLRGLTAAGAALLLGLPPLPNLLAHLPVFTNFHNVEYRWEYSLALATLVPLSLPGVAGPSPSVAHGRARARSAAMALAVCAVGVLGARALAPRLSAWVPAGSVDPSFAEGGILGPERAKFGGPVATITGWIPADGPPPTATLILSRDGRPVATVPAATFARRFGRLFFRADVPLPDPAAVYTIDAAVARAGASLLLKGPTVSSEYAPGAAVLIACALLFPAAFLLSPFLARWLAVLLVLFCVAQHHCAVEPADQIPFRLPGVERLAAAPGGGRATSVQNNFLSADYLTIYGVSEFRPFGDDIGVLPMFYFFTLSSHYWGRLDDARAFETGLRLLGAAGVRWLLFFPGTERAHPGLRPFYDGPDMSVAENRHALPRAAFFSSWESVPLGDWRDWPRRNAMFARFVARLDAGLDPTRTLALDGAPEGAPPSRAAAPIPVPIVADSATRVVLSVEAPSPGFVLLSDNVFPGWSASVDGRPAPIRRAWIAFRAVQVPAGRSIVEFVYRPYAVWAGLALTALVALGLAAAWAGARRTAGAFYGGSSEAAAAELLLTALVGSSLLYWTIWACRAFCG